jgi:hypothetical protein
MLKNLLVILVGNVLRFCGIFFLISAVCVLLVLALQPSLTPSMLMHGIMAVWGSFFTNISNAHPALIAMFLILFVFITVDHALKARKEN